MSDLVAWIEAIGTWVAPVVIFGAGYYLGDRRDRRSASMKVLIEASDHAQRVVYVCDQGRSANAQLAKLNLDASGMTVDGVDYEPLEKRNLDNNQIREVQAQLRLLNERRAERSVALNSDCMMADLTFGAKADPLVKAIKGLISSTDHNEEAQVTAAFAAVTDAIRLLAHEIMGRR